MIEKLKFQDIKMFKGKHSIEFKPLTIFTGTNNSGKSTLLSLTEGLVQQFGDYLGIVTPFIKNLYPLTNKTSGTRVRLGANDSEGNQSYIHLYYLKNLVLNQINASFHPELTEFPEKITFHYKNESVISFDPNVSELRESTFYYTLSINFVKLFALLKSESTKSQERKKVVFILEDILNKGLTEGLLKTNLVDKTDIGPVFYINPDLGLQSFEIRIFASEYSHITNTKSNDFFFFYVNNIINSVLINNHIEKESAMSFAFLLKYTLFNFFLFPIKEQVDNYKNLINLSAYKGKFVNESKSQAYEILSNILNKQNELRSDDAWARFFKNRESNSYSNYRNEKNYYGSKLAFLKRWINEFGIGNSINFEKKPVNLISLIQDNKSKRYPFELGFGNQQFLPILLSFCNTRNGLFLIEEPESHLHPNLQSKLADFFSDALNMDKSAQFIIETHSEYFIRKLQFLIAKGKIDKSAVALYYVHNSKSIPKDQKQIQRMEIRDDGIIKQEFGTGFFDESAHLAMDLLNIKRSN